MVAPDNPFNIDGEQPFDALTPILVATKNHQLQGGGGQDEEGSRSEIPQ